MLRLNPNGFRVRSGAKIELIGSGQRCASSAKDRACSFSGKAEVWVRGRSSAFDSKKPYRLELEDELGKSPLSVKTDFSAAVFYEQQQKALRLRSHILSVIFVACKNPRPPRSAVIRISVKSVSIRGAMLRLFRLVTASVTGARAERPISTRVVTVLRVQRGLGLARSTAQHSSALGTIFLLPPNLTGWS